MGAVSRETYNYELMEQADYKNPKKLQNLVKNYDNIRKLAKMGDGVALSIYVDLKHAIYIKKVLTDKQMECIEAVLINDMSLTEYAGDTFRSVETIRNSISGGIKRLSKELESGKLLSTH